MFILSLTLQLSTSAITYFDLSKQYNTVTDCLKAGDAWAKQHAEPSQPKCTYTDHPQYWRK